MNRNLEDELRVALRRKEPLRDLMPRKRASSRWLAVAAGVALLAMQYGRFEKAERERKAKDQLVFAVRLAAGKLQMTQQRLGAVK